LGPNLLGAPSTTPDVMTMIYEDSPTNSSTTHSLSIATRTDISAPFSSATPTNLTAGDGAYNYAAAISADALTVYFQSETAPGNVDIYVATRPNTSLPFGTAVPVTEVNTPANEGDPFITADGTTLYFDSDRPGGTGGWEIYSAVRQRM
jgi:hypothetical protein